MDRFRVRERIAIGRWADESGIARTQLGKYRSGKCEPRSNTLAALVRAASSILDRPVRASELYDLGEDEPVAERRQHPPLRNDAVRKSYASRFDRLLRRIGLPPNAFAREAALSRQALLQLRMNSSPAVPTIRRIVVTLRRMGHAVRAADIVDVGED